jgi:hypothetical protein
MEDAVTGARGRPRLSVWGLLAVGLVAPPAARARDANPPAVHSAPARPDPSAEARRQFMIGERLFRSGRYQEAARAYQRGYRLSRRPGFLINIADCQVRLGRPELAREQYRRFLAAQPDGPLAAQVAQALADLDAEAAGEVNRPGSGRPGADVFGSPRAADQLSGEVAPRGEGGVDAGPTEPVPLPLGVRDRLHAPSAAEQALGLRAPAMPDPDPPRWLWPAVGAVAVAVVAGTVAVFAARDPRSGPVSRGSIGTIRR